MNPAHSGRVVHEIHPRSQRPKTWRKLDNRVLLCNECHEKIHREGANKWVETLEKLQKEWKAKYRKGESYNEH